MCSSEIPRSSAASPAPPARPIERSRDGHGERKPEQEPDRTAAHHAFPGREPVRLLKLDPAVGLA